MLGAHALYKIDYLEVSLLYLLRKIWAHDNLCKGPMRFIKLIIKVY